MKTVDLITLGLALAISWVSIAEEVLPVVPEEKLTEYRNAFGRAIERGPEPNRGTDKHQAGADSKHPPRLESLADQMKGEWNEKGPPPPRGDGAGKAPPPNDLSKGFPDALHGKHRPPGSDPGPRPGPGPGNGGPGGPPAP